MTREELKDLIWKQNETFSPDAYGLWTYGIRHDGEWFESHMKIPTNEVPGDEEVDWSIVYDENKFHYYKEALDDILNQINEMEKQDE